MWTFFSILTMGQISRINVDQVRWNYGRCGRKTDVQDAQSRGAMECWVVRVDECVQAGDVDADTP